MVVAELVVSVGVRQRAAPNDALPVDEGEMVALREGFQCSPSSSPLRVRALVVIAEILVVPPGEFGVHRTQVRVEVDLGASGEDRPDEAMALFVGEFDQSVLVAVDGLEASGSGYPLRRPLLS